MIHPSLEAIEIGDRRRMMARSDQRSSDLMDRLLERTPSITVDTVCPGVVYIYTYGVYSVLK